MQTIMNLFIFVILGVVLAEDEIASSWSNFKQDYKKAYPPLEELFRYSVFQENFRKVEEHNAKFEKGLVSFEMGIQVFGDLTSEEFKDMMGIRPLNVSSLDEVEFYDDPDADSDRNLLDSINWVQKGAVTPVKMQGGCGSCWAFSTTGALEGINYIKNNELLYLSEQHLLDCNYDGYTCFGCSGCWPETPLKYVSQNGIQFSRDYPYEGRLNYCRYNRNKVAMKIADFKRIRQTEFELQKAVAQQPVSVCINADYWQMYIRGVYDIPYCGQQVNHAVLVVGYGEENGKEYWLVKNSWGSHWGENGYIKMKRNSNNQCGIASYALIPLM